MTSHVVVFFMIFLLIKEIYDSSYGTCIYLLQRYERLFEKNAESGSFYLQSKVQRAKECLESQMKSDGANGV